MSQQFLQRARLQCCHAQVFANASYSHYDALHVWYVNR